MYPGYQTLSKGKFSFRESLVRKVFEMQHAAKAKSAPFSDENYERNFAEIFQA